MPLSPGCHNMRLRGEYQSLVVPQCAEDDIAELTAWQPWAAVLPLPRMQ
jgi:hypothetical protein